MTNTIRTTAAALLIAAAAALALAPVTASHTVRHLVTPDQGCSLFVAIPNPCEPDSAN